MYFTLPSIIFPLFLSFYLYDRFRKQKYRNSSTFYWFLGFLTLSLTAIFHSAYAGGLLSGFNYQIFYFIRALMFIVGIIFFYLGVIRLISASLVLKILVPVFALAFTVSSIVYALFVMDNFKLATLFGLFILIVPLEVVMAILFILLYSHLAFIRDGYRSNLGPLLIALGWLFHALAMSWLYFFLDQPGMEKWLLIINIPTIFWVVGLVMLERETKKVFNIKLRIHGLKKKEE